MNKYLVSTLFIMAFILTSCSNPVKKKAPVAQNGGKVLVILSSSDTISLKNSKNHATGFYFPELMTPLKMVLDAGYTVEYASPKGGLPIMDISSDSSVYFGDAEGAPSATRQASKQEYEELRDLCSKLELCGPRGTTRGSLKTRPLTLVINEGLDQYAGVLIPGGHAPMEDLVANKDLGKILRYFNDEKTRKPVGLICHAPVALLSAMKKPKEFIKAFLKDDRATMKKLSKDWIYRDYEIAVFTTREETMVEGPKNPLGGFVKFYPDEILEKAGAYVTRADRWQSHVRETEEIVTGQNPGSHTAFGEAFVKALDKNRNI